MKLALLSHLAHALGIKDNLQGWSKKSLECFQILRSDG
jgi:hypothetical protein